MSTAGGRRPWSGRGAALGRPGRGGEHPERGGGSLRARLDGLSEKRRRGLLRLAALLGALSLVVVLGVILLALGGDPANPNAIVYQDAADTEGPLDILSAQMNQRGPQLVLSVRTAGIWTPGQLSAEPGRSVCTTLWAQDDESPKSRICVVSRQGSPSLALQRYRNGQPERPRPMAGEIRRRNLRLLEARFSFRDAKLPLGKFRWQVATLWAGEPGGCPTAATPLVACADQLPDKGTSPGTVTKPLLLGCTSGSPDYVLNGPRAKRVVALTFDDGPSAFTGQVLDILKRQRINATFFVVGENVKDRPGALRRALDEGNAVANHTFTHINTAGAGPEVSKELDRTSAAIKAATNFTPCLFRPPFGAKSARSIALARRKGMQTVGWEVDPSDYRRPGSGDIIQKVLKGVRPGSIVLMHDGGGPREQTVQALPAIIKGLRAKGYKFVTVDKLLGAKGRYA